MVEISVQLNYSYFLTFCKFAFETIGQKNRKYVPLALFAE